MGGKFIILIGDGNGRLADPGDRQPHTARSRRKTDMDFMAPTAPSVWSSRPERDVPGQRRVELSILGYDPAVVYTGRSPLEAASIGISLGPDDVAVRCNVVALKYDGADSEMEDFSAGTSPPPSGGAPRLSPGGGPRQGGPVHTGVSYRHLMIWPGGSTG